MRTPLVRGGRDATLPRITDADGETSRPGHTFDRVHIEMLLQICADYNSLPDVRTLRAHEIRFFYNGIRAGLHKTTGQK